MATTTKKKAKKAPSKSRAKKAPTKKAPTAAKLPEHEQAGADPSKARKAEPLPRGQEKLPNGDTRLKTGDHDLPNTPAEFDVHGAKLTLSGPVLIAGKNVNWLAIVKCQKCSTPRTEAVKVQMKDGFTVVTYRCHNDTECQIGGGRLYVAVYDSSKLAVEA